MIFKRLSRNFVSVDLQEEKTTCIKKSQGTNARKRAAITALFSCIILIPLV